MKHLRSILSILLAVVLLAGTVPTVAFAAPPEEDGDGGIAFTKVEPTIDPRLPELFEEEEPEDPEHAPEDIVRVSIILEGESALDRGYPIATIGTNKAASAYQNRLCREQEKVTDRIEREVLGGGELKVVTNLTLVANLISAEVKYSQIEEIKEIEGVKDVVLERIYEPLTGVQTTDEDIEEIVKEATEYTGAGSRIAIIDSGVNDEHQSFSADALNYSLRQSAPDTDEDGEIDDNELKAYKESLDFMTLQDVLTAENTDKLHVRLNGADPKELYINDKIPFAYNYSDYSLFTKNGSAGIHGSHVSGIAAANAYIPHESEGGETTYVKAEDAGAISGTAPDAQILNLKVMGNSLCTDAVIAMAVEDALILGADVLNLSLGVAEVGFSCADSVFGEVFDMLTAKGVLIMGAVGNDGSWIDENRDGRPKKLYSDDVNLSLCTPPSSYADLMGVAWADGASVPSTVNESSSYGIPSSLMLQPEITAYGTKVNSVNGNTNDGYTELSGTSMASPDVAGAAAVVAQYVNTAQFNNGQSIMDRARKMNNSLNQGMIVGGLLMSTADPMTDPSGNYYSLLRQGAGLLNTKSATEAKSFLEVAGQTRGRVKAEVGDCPSGANTFDYTFTLHNVSDTARDYVFKTDLFTEDTVVEGGVTYLADRTRALVGAVTYTIDGKPVDFESERSADVNRDKKTDVADAQALLDYISGENKGDGFDVTPKTADLDNDGKITTYDAHLILKGLKTSAVNVPANSSVTVKVHIHVTEDLSEDYPKGAYLEGFTSVIPIALDGAEPDVTHTIPILGFCGNWSAPSMFDRNSFIESFNGLNKTVPYTQGPSGVYDMNYMTYQDEAGNLLKQTVNPYDNNIHMSLDNLALSLEDTIRSVTVTLIRPAGAFCFAIMTRDADGNRKVARLDAVYIHQTCAFPSPRSLGGWSRASTSLPVRVTLEKLLAGTDVKEGDKIELGVVALPEYYEATPGRPINGTRIKELIEKGALGEGAYMTTTVALDSTAPEVTKIEKSATDSTKLQVTAEDGQNVAFVGLYSGSGTYEIERYIPVDDESTKNIVVEFDTSKLQNGGAYNVVVGDYAGNRSMYSFTYGAKRDLSQMVIANVRSSSDRSAETNRGDWVAVRPDRFSFRDNKYGNGFVFANAGASDLLAGADAADNYLWQAFEDGRLYVAPLDNVTEKRLVCDLPSDMEVVRDLAFNTKDKMLYATDGTDTLWRIDPMSGDVKSVQKVTVKGKPAALYGLAVNNYGTAVATHYDESKGNSVLISWEIKDDVDTAVETTGNLSNLSKSRFISLSWKTTSRSDLYAAYAADLNSPNTSNHLYEITSINLEHGACLVQKTNQGTINEASLLFNAVRGLVSIPAIPTLNIVGGEQTPDVKINIIGAKSDMVVGDTAQLSAVVVPWNVEYTSSDVKWQSSSNAVTVSASGLVTAVNEGTATVTATLTLNGESVSSEFEVNVKAAPSIDVTAVFCEGNGLYYWENFNTATPNNRKRLASAGAYTVGTLNHDGDCLYLFSGTWAYRVNPKDFTRESLEASVDAQHAHADGAPGRTMGNFTQFGYLTVSKNETLLLGSRLGGSQSGFETVSVSFSTGYANVGAMGGIAYKGVEETEDLCEYKPENKNPENEGKKYEADVYYVINEGGDLYELYCYVAPRLSKSSIPSIPDAYYETELTYTKHLGHVDGVSLPGVSQMQNYATSSMIYDSDSKLLVLVSKVGNGAAKVQVIDPATHSLVMTREFDDDVRQVGVLYQYDYSDYPDMNAAATTEAVRTYAVTPSVDVAEETKTVTYDLTGADTTNGKVTVKYDPEVLTFKSCTMGMTFDSYHVDATAGTVTIAFADAAEITPSAQLTFTYEPQETEQTTNITVTEVENGDPKTHTPVPRQETVTLPQIPAARELESIEISRQPTKTEYIEGQTLDTTGLEVQAVYSDGSKETLKEGEYEVSIPSDFSTPGTKTVTVTYNDLTATFQVTVKAKSVESIEITKQPTKTEYIEGTKFEDAGMELTLYYNNNTTEVVKTGWTVSYDFSTPGQKPVTVTYGGKTETLTVNVVAKSLVSIAVTKNPDKMEYIEGTKFEDTGMELTLTYDNGTTEKVTSGWTVNYDFSTPGQKPVTVTYGGKTATLTVTVVAKSLVSIVVTKNPDKMEYIEGTEFDSTGMELTLYYNNDTNEVVKTGWTVSYDFSTPGKKVVTVTYEGKTTTLTVNVVAKSLISIAITKNPEKMEYIEGTKFEGTGMELTLYYNNGTNETIKTGWDVKYDFSTPGKTDVTVTYEGKTTTLTVTVVAKSLVSIAITKDPDKMEYIEGTAFEDAGMELTLTYDNGTTETIAEGWEVEYDFTAPGEAVVTVTYGGKTTTLTVTVVAKSLVSIAITKNPEKMEYIEGTAFEDAGMELTLTYDNGTTETITEGWEAEYDFTAPGEAVVTVTYGGKTATLTVTVVPKSLVSITISKNPDKMEYIEGTAFEDAGMELTLTYDNGTTETITEGWEAEYDFTAPGEAVVTVTYGGKTATLTVTVVPKSLVSITISKNPDKMEYIEGTEFEDAGMELTLTYDNGATETITEGWEVSYDFTAPGEAVVTVTYEGKTTTLTVTVVPKSLVSIEITKDPTKMEYIEGTEFDGTGMELTLYYNNGTNEVVKTGWKVDYDFSTPGDKTVTVTYEGKAATLTVTVVAKSLVSIAVTKDPDKMEYIEGTEFDGTGMELTLTYDNDTTETITEGWEVEYDFTALGEAVVTVTYGGKTTILTVTVVPKSLVSISISKDPDKMEYIEGTEFDGTGMELTLTYDNGTTDTITEGWEVEYDFTAPGEAVVTVTYEGKTATLTVKVVPKSLTGIELTALPEKLVYLEASEELDVRGGKLTLRYDNGTTEEIDLTEDMISGFDNTKPGKQTVTVTYGGFTATFEVTVRAKDIDHIAVTRAPDKMEYVEGTEFDPKGMEVTIYYNNGQTEVITGGWEVVYAFDKVGPSAVKVSYAGHEAALTVTVVAKSLTRIEVTKLPDNTEYTKGDKFDGAGMELTLYYDNGTVETITEGWTAEYDFSVPGEREVKVSYGGVETVLTVTVKDTAPAKPDEGKDDEIPSTGDETLSIWFFLMLSSGAVLLVLLAGRKKRNH